MNKRTFLASVAAGLAMLAGGARAAEVDEVKIASQYGIGYLPLTVMQVDKLIEKHLAKAGLASTKVTWSRLAAGAAANDALLAGGLHFASGGTGPALILWDRTRSSLDVRGVGALSSMPNLLVTRDPNIKTVRDFTEKDRISMAGAGSSVQTVYLQMAVAKEFGIENYKKLNPLMVNLPHPEGLQTLLSGSGEIKSLFTSPPFQYTALASPGVRTVLNSYDVMGGPNTFLMVWATNKFREANPKTFRAVLDALKEATASINADKPRAAAMYVKEGGGKESVDQILKMMNDPQVEYTLAPQRLLPYAQFMNKVGSLKNNPNSWKDLFFPEIHDLPGS
ncbi:ABC transporter substrate-binding protein [Piscinibacter koreensis]|uniref:ABC transporter substrate-binding protein n=1 Tax=Piscinibacter koreensis TaxID=2742824 RepID=A0A7Y6TV42_9BURK|nr:ABC transporter substrate-binding protein [Schlegelella koreensis]NUZ04699.1 ABC transporter substrate-binding protein [Schlegelella koreensis]